MSEAVKEELIALNQRLLESIAAGDWATYEQLCDPQLTCFEPEARGQLVAGMEFHHFYFEEDSSDSFSRRNTTMCSPQVWLLGDAAVLAYVRLVQHTDAAGNFITSSYEETRVWQKRDGAWKHVHFHRSLPS